MTELERILTQSLTTLEQELTATLETHDKRLSGQQLRLEAQAQEIQSLRRTLAQIQTEQQESTRHLQRLSDIHTSLEPLLTKLNTLLNGR